MANHQEPEVTPESLERIEFFLPNMNDSLKLKLSSFILDNLEDFRSGRATHRYSHCPVPASFDEGRVVGGQLQFSEDGKEVDCTKMQGGKIIPNLANVTVVDMKSSTGEFILVVQRYDNFRRLAAAASKFIVVNVEEELDSKTKLFLCKLKKELKLPVLALVDSSPDALKIISTVSQCCGGCDVTWIGIFPSELDEGVFAMPDDHRIRIPMTASHLETLEDLMKNDVFIQEKMTNLKLLEEPTVSKKNLIRNAFWEKKRNNGTWHDELTKMKKSMTTTRVEDFGDFMSMLYTMVLVASEPCEARTSLRGDQE